MRVEDAPTMSHKRKRCLPRQGSGCAGAHRSDRAAERASWGQTDVLFSQEVPCASCLVPRQRVPRPALPEPRPGLLQPGRSGCHHGAAAAELEGPGPAAPFSGSWAWMGDDRDAPEVPAGSAAVLPRTPQESLSLHGGVTMLAQRGHRAERVRRAKGARLGLDAQARLSKSRDPLGQAHH